MSAIDDIVTAIQKAVDDLDTVINDVTEAIDETDEAINAAEALGATTMVVALSGVKDNLENWRQQLQASKDTGEEYQNGAQASGDGA